MDNNANLNEDNERITTPIVGICLGLSSDVNDLKLPVLYSTMDHPTSVPTFPGYSLNIDPSDYLTTNSQTVIKPTPDESKVSVTSDEPKLYQLGRLGLPFNESTGNHYHHHDNYSNHGNQNNQGLYLMDPSPVLAATASTTDYGPFPELKPSTSTSDNVYNITTEDPLNELSLSLLWQTPNADKIDDSSVPISGLYNGPSTISPSVPVQQTRSYPFSLPDDITTSYHQHHVHHPSYFHSESPSIPTQSGPTQASPSSTSSSVLSIGYADHSHSYDNLLTSCSPNTATPSTGNCYYRPFERLSSSSSSCYTPTSSLIFNSPSSSSLSSTSSLSSLDSVVSLANVLPAPPVDSDCLFTIDAGDLSSCSSTSTSSSSSSSSSSRLPRKRSSGFGEHFHRKHNAHNQADDDCNHYHNYYYNSSKLSKREKMDQTMSEDKRLEMENCLLREKIKVMEHQFKLLQTKITDILVTAAKNNIG